MQISLLIASCWQGKRPTRRARSGYSTWRQSGSGWPIRRKRTVRLITCTKTTCALIRGRKSLLQGGFFLDFSPVDRIAAIERKDVNQGGSSGRGGGKRRPNLAASAASAPWRCQRPPRGARHWTHPVGFDAREDVNQLIPRAWDRFRPTPPSAHRACPLSAAILRGFLICKFVTHERSA